MDFEKKQFLDYAGLALYDELIKKYIDASDDELKEKIAQLAGEADTDLATLSEQLEELKQYVGEPSSDTEAASGLTGEVEKNAAAIADLAEVIGVHSDEEGTEASGIIAEIEENRADLDMLMGDGEGSISEAVKKAVDDLVDGAPEALDTLKEIADWIKEDETASEALVAKVEENADAIADLQDALEALDADHRDALAALEEKHDLEVSDLRDYVDAQDKNVYDSIGSIESAKIEMLFLEKVEVAEGESIVDALADLEEGEMIVLADGVVYAEDFEVPADVIVDANGAELAGKVVVNANATIMNAVFSGEVVVK